MRNKAGFSLVEVLACGLVLAVLCILVVPGLLRAYESSALAVSASNIRQLTAGGMQYLADNDHRFWKYRENAITLVSPDGAVTRGSRFWFGFETTSSAGAGEGARDFDAQESPLAGYVPKGIRPDPSFATHVEAFKPKFKCGYLGVGYNVVLGGGWSSSPGSLTKSYWQLSNPAKVVVFATSAQINDFQAPASPTHPMLEEFYGFDQNERTIHFRQDNMAMVGFADGSSGFLPLDKSTRDNRLKGVTVGRFAPAGSFQYLK